ncbi:wall-associated receptor kinase-like 10 [Quercus robur]|uniref:wall-associated receptor kinase-like 10 n=1 Tax=Quercus robur TaxID=38942 RepID=UPI0021626AFA|nr:wall-associated receptor kinase-like 10 [Quercus robur]
MKMAVQFVMRITILVLLTYELAEAEAAAACYSSCGNLEIPYPFGIGPHCYMDKMFEVVCNGTGSSVKAFLTSIDKEVLQINISSGAYNSYPTVQVQMPIIYSNGCSSSGSGEALNISGSPFNFSFDYNTFISVGCDNFATITGLGPVVFGCKSHCNKGNIVEGTRCSGFNCCQSEYFPINQQEFHVEFRSISESKVRQEEECKYAFLMDQNWLKSNKPDPSSVQYWETVPVVLEWAISKRTKNSRDMFESHKNLSDVSCSFSDEDMDFDSFTCECAYGYQGNPYLPRGCKDINECESKNLDQCPYYLECENIEGSFNCNKRKSPDSPLRLAIIVICPSFGLLFLLLIIWWLYKVIKKRNKIKLKQKFFKRNGGLLLQQQLSSNENNVQKAKLFNSKELKNATNCFNENRILGKGGQGTVYKGMLIDARIVAIKKCNKVDEGNLEQFANEIIILSQINHRNVVKLLGCCLETEVPLLVYEFIPNGTLFQYLHEENEDFPLLTWDMRLRIATEIAGALSYLHSAASLPIYHRDIKSSNILLDEKYRAKVADFGTSRSVTIDQTHVTTLIYGTFGYLDPEYFQTSQFTEKSDVYSFGVVLIELLTGEKPVSLTRSQEGRNLSTYFVHSLKENRLFDILDTQVSKVCNKDEVIVIANLAKRCVHLNGKKRPTMMEIMMELEGVQKVSTAQLNFEELEYVRNEEMGLRNDVSVLASSCLESGSASSSDVLPLLSI